MFADTEDVKPDLIGQLDFGKQVSQALRRGDSEAGEWVCDGGGEAIDSDLHGCSMLRARLKARLSSARKQAVADAMMNALVRSSMAELELDPFVSTEPAMELDE